MLDAHVVAHTHWDREWYHPAERFRQRLVALIDELIDDPPGEGESFLLDGQTIVLDDYLAVRPERGPALIELLRAGRLEAGPWFVLADELIPGGEAIVRNLLTARRTLRRFGVDAPPVLYCPDSFGHPAALPSIASGFGLPLIILWRGFGSRRWPSSDVVRWRAPDGDEALVYHLPRDGYEFGSHLPRDATAASTRWTRMNDALSSRSATGVVLIPNGADHHARQKYQHEAVVALARAATPDDVHSSSLRVFSETLVATARETVDLPSIRGELRDSYGYTWTLQGTFATRAHEKRMNARAERLLLRDAEPWAALAARRGKSRRPLLEAAWRTLLEAHPHDTLCGCSIDAVADAMELRIRSADAQAIGVRDDALLDLIGHDVEEARQARERWAPILLVRNAATRARGGVAIVEVEQFVADVAVGPGSASARGTSAPPPSIEPSETGQRLSSEHTHRLTESPRDYPDNDLVSVTRVALWIEPVPAYGVAVLSTQGTPRQPVAVSERILENAYCRLEIADDGVVSLEDKTSGRRITSLVELVDDADVGDSYTPAPRPSSYALELTGIGEQRCRGPLIGDLAVRYCLRHDAIRTEIELRFLLEADAPWIRVEIEGENRLENHRLRARFRTDVGGDETWADAAFGPVRRVPLVVPPDDAAMEMPPLTAPLHRYVSRFDARHGVTVFSDGLGEYEAADDGSILVTLVRAIGELSVGDLPERPGHAGWPKQTRGAQCLRSFGGAFAVMLHGPRTPETIEAIERAADDILLPLRGTTLRSALHVPATVTGVALHGQGLAVSTIKESEDGIWLVLRCVNLLDDPVAGSWSVPFDVAEACRARLDETITEKLSSTDQGVSFVAEPRQIVTILVR